MKKIECFKIRLLEVNNDVFDIVNMKPMYDVLCNKFTFFKEPITIVADPFLFVKDDTLYLFYEYKTMYHPGVIAMTSTKDLLRWEKPTIVLQESYHLSFPYIFEENGIVYMIPETSANRTVSIYKADNTDLSSFRKVKDLIVEDNTENVKIGYVDSSIYNKDGMYYLNTSHVVDNKSQMKLFVSNTLLGEYKEHAESPFDIGPGLSRNGGSWFTCDRNIYRFAQDCETGYGNDVHLIKIDKLSPTEYKEHVVKRGLLANKHTFFKCGGHQYNIVKFHDRTIVATDAKEYHIFCWNRVLHKLGMYRM